MVGQTLPRYRAPWPDLADRSALRRTLAESSLFDAAYYQRQCPDLAIDSLSGSIDPIDCYLDRCLDHYLDQGWQNYRPNPLFDPDYYLQQHPALRQNRLNPLLHYLCEGAAQGSDPHPLFDTDFYLGLSPQVAAGLTPLADYLQRGSATGRIAFPVDRIVGDAKSAPPLPTVPATIPATIPATVPATVPATLPDCLQIGVYCHPRGSSWIADIADLLVVALTRLGHRVVRRSTAPCPADLDLDLLLAPHEVCELEGAVLDRLIGPRSILLNLAPPHTSGFAKAFAGLRQAAKVLDLNPRSAAVLNQLGIATDYLPLGYLPDYLPLIAPPTLPDGLALRSLPAALRDRLPDLEAPLTDRPIDLCFIGELSDRRSQWFAQHAACFSPFRCFWHLPHPDGAILSPDQTLPLSAAIGLSRRSKILLNIHRSEFPDGEWHRLLLQGLWQNTLVVTESCLPLPGLTAGQHYIECELAEMPDRLTWLLTDPQGQAEAERIRRAGHKALRQCLLLPRLQVILQSVLQSVLPAGSLQSSPASIAGGAACP